MSTEALAKIEAAKKHAIEKCGSDSPPGVRKKVQIDFLFPTLTAEERTDVLRVVMLSQDRGAEAQSAYEQIEASLVCSGKLSEVQREILQSVEFLTFKTL